MREIPGEYFMNYLHWRGQNPGRSVNNFHEMIGILEQNIVLPEIQRVLRVSN